MKIDYESLEEAAHLAGVPEQNKIFCLMMKVLLRHQRKISKAQAIRLCFIIGATTLPVAEVMKNTRGWSESANSLERLTQMIMKRSGLSQAELDAEYEKAGKQRKKLLNSLASLFLY